MHRPGMSEPSRCVRSTGFGTLVKGSRGVTSASGPERSWGTSSRVMKKAK
jgi:hypothetical protein